MIFVDAIAYATYNLAATTEAVNGFVGAEPKDTTLSEVIFHSPQGAFLGGGSISAGGYTTS